MKLNPALIPVLLLLSTVLICISMQTFASAQELPPESLLSESSEKPLMDIISELEEDISYIRNRIHTIEKKINSLKKEIQNYDTKLHKLKTDEKKLRSTLAKLIRALVRLREPKEWMIVLATSNYHKMLLYKRLIQKLATNIHRQLEKISSRRKQIKQKIDQTKVKYDQLSEVLDHLQEELKQAKRLVTEKRKLLEEKLKQIVAIQSLFTLQQAPTTVSKSQKKKKEKFEVNLKELKGKKKLRLPVSPGKVVKRFDEVPKRIGNEKMVRGWILVPLKKGKKKEAVKYALVFAPAPGKVVFVGDIPGFGLTIILDHGYGYHTVYAHLDSVSVGKGEWVKKGETLGKIRALGNEPPYLYFEMRENRIAVSPRPWFYLRPVRPGE